ncbi:hypothetical protein EAH57_05675 [Acinetobacter sp. 2JN-4]|uniref:hypothetical protein n=1 Tax=Acinetobacter sp. 2JN-4 TaxID=2479844 RepID=UPI000EF9E29D|nr:hypothetical protein [Acinetobacter sp. 2JN-4]RLZ09393.1 hypothetical protein EAH57_05675 [Acinetobacter sp. 2JN-4]
MKIAYLGGFKDGEVLVLPAELNDPVQLNWVIQHDDVRKAEQDLVDHSNRDFTLTMKKSLINYNLMLLKKDKETRLFYVEEGLSKVKILERLNEHWKKSQLIGFDFD